MAGEGETRLLLFKEYRVSVLYDKKVLEMDNGNDSHKIVNISNETVKCEIFLKIKNF